MDDFRVGSVSSTDPYGCGSSGSTSRKKGKRSKDQAEQDEPAGYYEPSKADEAGDTAEAAGEPVEDYYAPSEKTPDQE